MRGLLYSLADRMMRVPKGKMKGKGYTKGVPKPPIWTALWTTVGIFLLGDIGVAAMVVIFGMGIIPPVIWSQYFKRRVYKPVAGNDISKEASIVEPSADASQDPRQVAMGRFADLDIMIINYEAPVARASTSNVQTALDLGFGMAGKMASSIWHAKKHRDIQKMITPALIQNYYQSGRFPFLDKVRQTREGLVKRGFTGDPVERLNKAEQILVERPAYVKNLLLDNSITSEQAKNIIQYWLGEAYKLYQETVSTDSIVGVGRYFYKSTEDDYKKHEGQE